jgi:hypothetical protein
MTLIRGLGLVRPSPRRTTDPEEITRRGALEERRRISLLEEDERSAELQTENNRWVDEQNAKMLTEMKTEKPAD